MQEKFPVLQLSTKWEREPDIRPVARGVQTGAIAPPPLDARSAWQAI